MENTEDGDWNVVSKKNRSRTKSVIEKSTPVLESPVHTPNRRKFSEQPPSSKLEQQILLNNNDKNINGFATTPRRKNSKGKKFWVSAKSYPN